MSDRLLGAVLALIAVLSLATDAAAADDTGNPLQPLDTSSPRATLGSFMDQTRVVEEAAIEYRTNRSLATQNELFREMRRTSQLSDLSEVPSASRDQVVEQNFAALADILLRIPLPDPSEIPDAESVLADELTQWTLPGTAITFTQLSEGDRAGAWVLSPTTVASLPGWREQVEGSPVLVDDAKITNWRRTSDLSTGPLIPAGLIAALPDVADERVLGSPLWKSIAALIGAVLIALAGALWYRLIGRRGRPGTVRRHLMGATTPAIVMILIVAYEAFMSTQINHSGALAQVVLVGTTIAFWIFMAWLFAELVLLLTEWIIATPYISGERYDANLLRLIAKLVVVVGVVLILLFGANEIGIPALGLIAGLGVGGLVIGLAAQSTAENLIGGMTLYADKPFHVDDFVAFGEDQGTVELIGPRSTRIRKLDGTRLTVPNSDIVQARISNFTQRNNALFLHTIGVRYETTIEQIERLTAAIRGRMRGHAKVVVDDDMPRVRLAGFGASSIDIETRAYVDTTNIHEFMAVQEELLAMILREVEAAGTGMAFPSTTAYLTRDGGIAGLEAGPPGAAEDGAAEDGVTLDAAGPSGRPVDGRETGLRRPRRGEDRVGSFDDEGDD